MQAQTSILMRSNAIFTAVSEHPFAGFVAVKEKRIVAVGEGDGKEFLSDATEIFDLGNKLICPGFSDVHCFFSGYLLGISGVDLSESDTAESVMRIVRAYAASRKAGETVLGRNLQLNIPGIDANTLDKEFGDTPCILFMADLETCVMNTAARNEYGFTPETCWSESYWRLLKYILREHTFSQPEFERYLAMMNSRGITSVKEMGFDDFYGFTDILEKLEQENKLPMRVHFMSQPVGAPMNLAYGKAMRDRFKGEFVRFSGYNQMTDGSIGQHEGQMKKPYLDAAFCCKKQIDWAGLERDALAADTEGFRFSLHAQGDGAIGKTLDIFEKCARRKDGKVVNRHAMTDLECSDPSDLERMGKLGVVAEIYPQIMSIANRKDKLAMIEKKIGMERGHNYWNRRKMADSGVVLACGTDLPLLYDDIPESVYHAVGALFPEGGEPFNKQNTLTVAELLKAWTLGGQYDLIRDDELGSLVAGKLADIAVLDANLFDIPPESTRDVKVCLTIVDGNVVYNAL